MGIPIGRVTFLDAYGPKYLPLGSGYPFPGSAFRLQTIRSLAFPSPPTPCA